MGILHRYMDVTYSGNAGAIAEERISAIHGARTRIRPLWTVEVQVLHRYMDVTYSGKAGAIAEEQKTCLAGDGLSKKLPTHISSG